MARLQPIVSAQATRAALSLRSAMFRQGRGDDRDGYDDHGVHLDIRDLSSGRIAACLRCHVHDPAEVKHAYSAQFYDLTPLSRYPRPMVEVGRFCVAPGYAHHPDVVRLGWSVIARIVADHGAGLLFGCTCVDGAPVPRQRHDPPNDWQVSPRGVAVPVVTGRRPALAGRRNSLLGLYLQMGGWASRQAVHDPDLGTLHVFTALEVSSIPFRRAQSLRRLATSPVVTRGPLVDAPMAER